MIVKNKRPVSNSITVAACLLLAAALLFTSCAGKEEIVPEVNSRGYKEVTTIGMTLQWKFAGSNLELIVKAPTTGWVGVGFDPDSAMKGASFIIGYVKDGEAIIADHYGDALTDHVSDESLGGSSDVTLIGGSETGGSTELNFSIPVGSTDEYDRKLSAGSKHKVLLAYGPKDDFETEHEDKNKRTSIEIEL